MAPDSDAHHWRTRRHRIGQARALRKSQTDAERRLWLALRDHRLCGLGFRRQHAIGPYVADFACLERRMVLEVDGGQHFEPAGAARDADRTAALAALGFTVLRFSNLDVLENLPGVLETIAAAAGVVFSPPADPPET
ncbi:endonuclease domain-containing protein [Azorhizobium sp. AG788]|uniref:endonuclease domain-containing protein n=1 Tax=Azorhizobium sp. AG788 TaxID=2183897 RepID=UPI0031386E01